MNSTLPEHYKKTDCKEAWTAVSEMTAVPPMWRRLRIRPLRDLIHFQPISKPGKIGLIHVPDSTKSTRNQTFVYAKVLAAGPNVELAKAGSTIFISEYAIEPFPVDGVPVHLMRERDIVGVVQEESYTIPLPKLTKKQQREAMINSPVPVIPWRDYGRSRFA